MGKAHWTQACFKKLNMSTVTYSFLLSRVDRFKQIHRLPQKKIPICASIMYFKGFQMLGGSKSLRGLKQFTLDINNDDISPVRLFHLGLERDSINVYIINTRGLLRNY